MLRWLCRSSSERRSPVCRSSSARHTGRSESWRAAASATCSATVEQPTPPLAPAMAIMLPPMCSATRARSSASERSRTAWAHVAPRAVASARASTVIGAESTSRKPARTAWRRRSGDASWAASSSSPTAGCLAWSWRASSRTGSGPSSSSSTSTSTSVWASTVMTSSLVCGVATTSMSPASSASAMTWAARSESVRPRARRALTASAPACARVWAAACTRAWSAASLRVSSPRRISDRRISEANVSA